MKVTSEASLYRPVKNWFLKQRGCDDAVADLPEETRKVRLDTNLHIGEIDVAAVETPRKGRRLIHLAEGKRFAKRESVSNCIAQADSVRPYADFLWVFFPKQDWLAVAEKDRNANKKAVEKQGLGLLLVAGNQCELVLDAPRNASVDDQRAQEVFEALNINPENTVPFIEPAGAMAARHGASMMALTRGIEQVLSDALGTNATWDDGWGFDCAVRSFYVSTLQWERQCYPQIDPFGCYLRDGVPALWIMRGLTPHQLRRIHASKSLPGTHVMFDNGRWEWEVIACRDLTERHLRQLIADGYGSDDDHLTIARHIPMLGRPQSAVARDVREAAKELDRKLP